MAEDKGDPAPTSSPAKSRLRKWLLRFTILFVSLMVSLVAAEIVLRAARENDSFYPHHKNSVKACYPSEEITPGISGTSFFSTNSLGCRGPKFAGEKHRMLTIGGSTTACTALDDSESWPHLVMQYVNKNVGDGFLWVTNSGIDGKNSRHHVAHAEFLVPKIGEIDIVLVYCGLNDVGRWLHKSDFDPDFLSKPKNWERTVAESFRISNYEDPAKPWYKRLELWKRASILKDISMSRKKAFEREQGVVVQDDRFRWIEEMRAHRRRAKKKLVPRAKLDTLPAALESYRANLRSIAKSVREAGARPIFMAQGGKWHNLSEEERDRLWMGLMDRGKSYAKPEKVASLIRMFDKGMADVCKELDVDFIDLPKAFEGKQSPCYDGSHFHEQGAREVARVVADHLLRGALSVTQAGDSKQNTDR